MEKKGRSTFESKGNPTLVNSVGSGFYSSSPVRIAAPADRSSPVLTSAHPPPKADASGGKTRMQSSAKRLSANGAGTLANSFLKWSKAGTGRLWD